MSYTNETTYYGLPLPTGSDKSTFTDNNTAFQAVDAALHSAYEQSGAATEDIVAIKATVANLIQADIDFQSDLDTEKGKIRNLQDKEVLQDTAIAAVKADAQDMITAYNEPTATSAHAYNVGDYFIYNDVLYRATASIAIGATIVPDTNCTTTNVSSELIQIKSDLSGEVILELTPNNAETKAQILTRLADALASLTQIEKTKLRVIEGSVGTETVNVYNICRIGTTGSFGMRNNTETGGTYDWARTTASGTASTSIEYYYDTNTSTYVTNNASSAAASTLTVIR